MRLLALACVTEPIPRDAEAAAVATGGWANERLPPASDGRSFDRRRAKAQGT
jgi:hypothetical protein